MHRDIERAYDALWAERQRIHRIHVKTLAQGDHQVERRLMRGKMEDGKYQDELSDYEALERLRNKLDYTTVGFQLLPAKFSLTELQRVYEGILGRNWTSEISAARSSCSRCLSHIRISPGRAMASAPLSVCCGTLREVEGQGNTLSF